MYRNVSTCCLVSVHDSTLSSQSLALTAALSMLMHWCFSNLYHIRWNCQVSFWVSQCESICFNSTVSGEVWRSAGVGSQGLTRSFSDKCNSCGCQEFQDLDSTIADASREVENLDRIPGGNLNLTVRVNFPPWSSLSHFPQPSQRFFCWLLGRCCLFKLFSWWYVGRFIDDYMKPYEAYVNIRLRHPARPRLGGDRSNDLYYSIGRPRAVHQSWGDHAATHFGRWALSMLPTLRSEQNSLRIYHLKPRTVEVRVWNSPFDQMEKLSKTRDFQKAQSGLPSWRCQQVTASHFKLLAPIFGSISSQSFSPMSSWVTLPGGVISGFRDEQVEIWAILEWRARCQSSGRMRKSSNLDHVLW